MKKNPLKMLWLAAAFLCSGSDPADFADNSILAGGIFLFCKRIGKISQVVYGNQDL